ncbi:unnamed protein product [Calypogeia fissa]
MTDRVYPETGANRNGFPRGPKGTYTNLKGEQPPPFQARPPPPQSARPQLYNDGGYNGRPRRRNCCCLFMAWSCCALVLIIFLLGIAALIFYLVVQPRAPKYNVEDVRLSNFAITPSGSAGLFQLSATTSYSVVARNPNKHIGIYYDIINIDVQSEGATIGQGSVPSFYQGHKNTTIIAGDLQSGNVPLVSAVGIALQSAEKNGNIPLVVAVDVRVRVKVGGFKTPHFWVHVRCNVDVNPNATGSQVLSKTCHVKS